ncbi:MAG TPA: CDP-alcohol phosphatidyltransferase family protein [Anaerolineales bacterium]|nr:CDP-alcohol phosphatidyltransferase family protein [Anaerolineales bacterium]HLO34384.1 CDP-alcohol phosphatidyltransferase family protein [Anaerolineales bacterium]
MGIYTTKPKWQKALQPIVDFCIARGVHPDAFTYGALVLSLIAALALYFANSNKDWLWLVLPCVLVRLLLNLMDGQVARALNLADDWGEVKNEFGDRIADALIFIAIGIGGYAETGLALVALTLILLVSYLGILGKALGGQRVYGGLFGKGDRMISLAIFTLYPALSGNLASYNYYLILAGVAALITIIQRLRIIYEYHHRA